MLCTCCICSGVIRTVTLVVVNVEAYRMSKKVVAHDETLVSVPTILFGHKTPGFVTFWPVLRALGSVFMGGELLAPSAFHALTM
jgi:hypothetical protein